MLFSSFSFLLWFLPLTLLFYFLPPALARARVYKRKVSAPGVAYDSEPWLPYQNGVLLVASLLFYAWGEPLYVFLMIGVILTDTLLGVLLERARRKRLWLALAGFLHVALLFYYKYAA